MNVTKKLTRQSAVWVDALRTGIWTVPLGMMLLSVIVYAGAMHIDRVVPDESMLQRWWLQSGSGDDARNLLSTLVTAIITMSSVVF